VVAERYFEHLFTWLERRGEEPEEWQAAELFGDTGLYLTPAELEELGEAVQQLVQPYLERTANAELRPEAARLVLFVALGFPLPEE
jgi:hypothetical protein